jgi:hypothetical protein
MGAVLLAVFDLLLTLASGLERSLAYYRRRRTGTSVPKVKGTRPDVNR